MTVEGRRAPTIYDVAERAGVSKSLVSLVLKDSPQVSDAKRRAVLAAVAELGYRVNAAARHLAEQRSRTVAVLLNDMRNPWFVDAIEGIGAGLADHGLRMLIGDRRLDLQHSEGWVRGLRELGVDGLVLVGSTERSAALDDVLAEVPAVLIGDRDPVPVAVDVIADDDLIGASLAVQHLIGLGHRRIAHLGGIAAAGAVARIRAEGYTDTMSAAGLQRHTEVVRCDLTEPGGREAARKILRRRKNRPTAVFAGTDVAAVGVLTAAHELGIAVPAELSVVGYDDTYLAQIGHIGLTSVNGGTHELGVRSVEALLARIDDPSRPGSVQLLAPQLVVRTSSGPAPGWRVAREAD